jgi:hypothetical protein
MLSKNLGLDRKTLDQMPRAPLYGFPGNLPNSLAQDKAEIGGEQVASKRQYTFHMTGMEPTKVTKAAKYASWNSITYPHRSTSLPRWSGLDPDHA